jgi:hypothetical protein
MTNDITRLFRMGQDISLTGIRTRAMQEDMDRGLEVNVIYHLEEEAMTATALL